MRRMLTGLTLAVLALGGEAVAQETPAPAETPPTARAPARELTPQQAMAGVWKLSGLGGRPLCRFELTSDARGRGGPLTVLPGCLGEWQAKGIIRWTARGKDLTLWNGRNQAVRSFRKVNDITYEDREEMNEYLGRGDMLFFGKVVED